MVEGVRFGGTVDPAVSAAIMGGMRLAFVVEGKVGLNLEVASTSKR